MGQTVATLDTAQLIPLEVNEFWQEELEVRMC